MTDAARQAAYYQATAAHYESMHVDPLDEHSVALALLAGLARHLGARSILDVGAGTGRGVSILRTYLPEARIVGVEPVQALREVGYANGIPADELVDGSGDLLPFADDSFDLVIETAVLHHVLEPTRVVREMCRVASRGVMLSDGNNIGQGSSLARFAKRVISGLGLWRAYIWVTTGGKMSKYSEGDGLFYSYSVFDNASDLKAKFPRCYMANTGPLVGFNLRHGTSRAVLIALRDPW